MTWSYWQLTLLNFFLLRYVFVFCCWGSFIYFFYFILNIKRERRKQVIINYQILSQDKGVGGVLFV